VSTGRDRQLHDLRRLANLHGIQTAYYDVRRERRAPPPETLLALLRALGAPVETMADVSGALRHAEQERWSRLVPPVAVSWEGEPLRIELRMPRRKENGHARFFCLLEEGAALAFDVRLSPLPATSTGTGADGPWSAKRLLLPEGIPRGFHRLHVDLGGIHGETLFLRAPRRAYDPPRGTGRSAWGIFLPLYALATGRSDAVGDLSDLGSLVEWVQELGGSSVGTLPLLSAFLSEPFDPSPYSPCSRLAWNELYLDAARVPGFERCAAARERAASAKYRKTAKALRAAPLVDYRDAMALKRCILEELARSFFEHPEGREAEFRRFLAANPHMKEYAAFRAVAERLRSPWPAWPAPLRDGKIARDAFGEDARRYHLFVQYALDLQLGEIGSRAGGEKPLYLDFPLGVGCDGYDAWRYRSLFAAGAAAGAPPDAFFSKGQNWGFSPLHPARNREDGYAYYRACLRHQMRHAGILRIDHVMGLHRLFWIPAGAAPTEGTYVRYPAEELYAAVALEADRHRTRIVGEDLGTVPRYVLSCMARHGFRRMFVLQLELCAEPAAFRKIPASSLASLNTHDMPTFASFWRGGDIRDRVALGLLDKAGAAREKAQRRKRAAALARFLRAGMRSAAGPSAAAALHACLAYLAASSAETVIVNLEDLWLEPAPQNTPGTWRERSNWVRKSRLPFEEFRARPGVTRALRTVSRLRERRA
jgi:4-alpha-glucanotransferase